MREKNRKNQDQRAGIIIHKLLEDLKGKHLINAELKEKLDLSSDKINFLINQFHFFLLFLFITCTCYLNRLTFFVFIIYIMDLLTVPHV